MFILVVSQEQLLIQYCFLASDNAPLNRELPQNPVVEFGELVM